jgi:hypothetical protein
LQQVLYRFNFDMAPLSFVTFVLLHLLLSCQCAVLVRPELINTQLYELMDRGGETDVFVLALLLGKRKH